jgi:predicted nuclease with TOPRIM domain
MRARVTIQDVRTTLSKFKNVVSFEDVKKSLREILEYIEFSFFELDKLKEDVEKLEKRAKKAENALHLAEMNSNKLRNDLSRLQSSSGKAR